MKARVFRLLLSNPYVDVIRTALNDGAQSYDDLLHCISQAMPPEQFKMVSPEQMLSAHLEAIAYINEKAGERGKPLLDYRLHLFLQNLTGILKLCPTCRRYFSGDVTHCSHDGHVLFAAYCHDIRFGVGKFNGQELSPVLERESTDHDLVHYALIGRVEDHLPDIFELRGNLTPRGDFEIQSDGVYSVAHLDAQNYEQLESDLIHLGDEKRDYLYLVHLVKTLLQIYGKSLGFVDNRELASRYSAIIRDEFADEFLFEFLRLNYPRLFSLNRALTYLQKRAEEVATSDLESAIFNELALWFYRMVAVPERMGGRIDLLALSEDSHDWSGLSNLQRELLGIFLRERAIDTMFVADTSDSHFIRFQKYWATNHYGVFIEDTISDDPAYRGFSLSSRSRTYVDFVESWTAQSIQQAVDQLVEQNVLTRELTPDDRVVYYLKSEYVRFNLMPSSYGEGEDGYVRMRKDLLFRAEAHSSDLKSPERINIESGLKSGDVHFVAATSTLELGIDIGDLDSVLMIGAPPTPANYAQRAGRAGRGTKHQALIVTFCYASSAHDTYAFRNPRILINGRVTAPRFNPANSEILKQHINAFVLGSYIRHPETLREFEENLGDNYRNRISQMQGLFGDWFDYEVYQEAFIHCPALPEKILRDAKGKLANYCYEVGLFPDYGFRRDQVIAIDVEDRYRLNDENTLDWKQYALTRRDTEQAIRFFVPDQVIYVAGEVYRTLNDGVCTELEDGARQFSCFYAEREELFAQQRKEIKQLDLTQHFTPAIADFTNVGGVLAVGYRDDCLLSFRNHGVRGPKRKPSATELQIPIGYDLRREAFVLRFDTLVCDEVMRHSLVAVLLREINRRKRLAESEIRLMLDTNLLGEQGDVRGQYCLFYDNDGNSNLLLKDILLQFEEILLSAYDALTTCDCKTDGCYNCIRSYNTQYFDEMLSKESALMFVGYLLGKNRFVPNVTPFTRNDNSFDLALNVQRKNNEVVVTSSAGAEYRQPEQDALNDAIFGTLLQAVYGEYRSGMKTLKIETRDTWLADAINNRSVNKGKEAFSRLQFALLKFELVEATKVS